MGVDSLVTDFTPGRVPGMSVWAIVVAAGSGSRFGERKQFEPLDGRRVLDWSLGGRSAGTPAWCCVVPADAAEAMPRPGSHTVVAGGATRSASVRAGLAAVPDDASGRGGPRRRPARCPPTLV